MDPNATLKIMRQLTKRVQSRPNVTATDADAHELAAALVDLDEWLSNGGFLPQEWSRP